MSRTVRVVVDLTLDEAFQLLSVLPKQHPNGTEINPYENAAYNRGRAKLVQQVAAGSGEISRRMAEREGKDL